MEISYEDLGEKQMLITLKGRIDLETIEPFLSYLRNLSSLQIVFNLRELNFVGSNGISIFTSALKDLMSSNPSGIRFCQVSSEFKRIFTATLDPSIDFFEDVSTAVRSLNEGPMTVVSKSPDEENPERVHSRLIF